MLWKLGDGLQKDNGTRVPYHPSYSKMEHVFNAKWFTEYGKQNSSLLISWWMEAVKAIVSDHPRPLPNNSFCLDVNYGFQVM